MIGVGAKIIGIKIANGFKITADIFNKPNITIAGILLKK